MTKFKLNLALILAIIIALAAGIYIYIVHYAPLPIEKGTEISVWYVSGDKAWDQFNDFADEYNKAEGKKLGVTVSAKAFSGEKELFDAVSAAKNDKLPDIVVCDTDMAALLYENDASRHMTDHFGAWDCAMFSEDYVERCTYNGELVAIPVGESYDIMMLNSAMYKPDDSLSDLEKLCGVSAEYYEKNGTNFFALNDYSDFFRTTLAQVKDDFDAVHPRKSQDKNSQYVYNLLAKAAFDYGLNPESESPALMVANGELPCAITSTTDIMSAADKLSLDDTEFYAYPCLEKGKNFYSGKVVGMTVCAKDESAVNASVMFIRWFVSADVNSRFIADSGYVSPVKDVAASNSSELCNKLVKAMDGIRADLPQKVFEPSAKYAVERFNFNEELIKNMNTFD